MIFWHVGSDFASGLLESKVRKGAMGLRQRRWPSIAPRFFMAADSVICALAFAHARQGRAKVIHEVRRRNCPALVARNTCIITDTYMCFQEKG